VPNLKSLKRRLTRALAVTTAGVSAFIIKKLKDQSGKTKAGRKKLKDKADSMAHNLLGVMPLKDRFPSSGNASCLSMTVTGRIL